MNLINKSFLEAKIITINNLNNKYINQNLYNKAIVVSQNLKIEKKNEIFQKKVDQFSSFSLFEQRLTTSRLSLIKKGLIGSSINCRKSFFINPKNDYFQFHQDRFFIDNPVNLKTSVFSLDIPGDIINIINYPMLLVLKPKKGGFICFFFGLKGFYPRMQIKKSIIALTSQFIKPKFTKDSRFSFLKSLKILPKKHCDIFQKVYLIRLPFNHFISKLSLNLKKKKRKKRGKNILLKKKRNKYFLSNIFIFDKKENDKKENDKND